MSEKTVTIWKRGMDESEKEGKGGDKDQKGGRSNGEGKARKKKPKLLSQSMANGASGRRSDTTPDKNRENMARRRTCFSIPFYLHIHNFVGR